jgi:hypothetical protein
LSGFAIAFDPDYWPLSSGWKFERWGGPAFEAARFHSTKSLLDHAGILTVGGRSTLAA